MTEKTKKGLVVIAFMLCAAVILSAVAFSHPAEERAELVAEDETESLVSVPANVEGNGISLMSKEISRAAYEEYGIMPVAESACTVEATVMMDGGATPQEYQIVDFSLAWASENHDSVSNFVFMTTTDTTATLSVLCGFSTQILLTAKSRLEPTKSAQVTIDYAKSLTGYMIWTADSLSKRSGEYGSNKMLCSNGQLVTLHLANSLTHNISGGNEPDGSWERSVLSTGSAVWDSIGTVENSVISSTVTCKYTDGFFQKLYTDFFTYHLLDGQTITLSTSVNQYVLLYDMFSADAKSAYMTRALGSSAVSNPDATVTNRFLSLLAECEKPIEVTLKLTLKYGSPVTYTFYLDVEVEPVSVRSVDVSPNGLIFTAEGIWK